MHTAHRPAPARRDPVVEVLHGHRVADPYRWLEDGDGPDTTHWLTEQDALWRRHRAELPGLEHVRSVVADLSDAGMVTAPVWRGGRRFVLRRAPGATRPVLHLETSTTSRPLLDPAALGDGVSLDHWQPDPHGRLLTYQVSRHGDERAELWVTDVDTGEVVDGPIDGCRYSPIAWLPDGRAFYYVRTTRTGRSVLLHRVGTHAGTDLPFTSGDPTTSYGLGISHDGHWLVISATTPAAPGNAVWLVDLTTEPQRTLVVQQAGTARTAVDVDRDGRLYVATTADAPTGRLCVADPAHPDRWTELVRGDDDTVLTGFTVLDGADLPRPLLLVSWIRQAIGEITVHDPRTGERTGLVPMPGAGTIGPLTADPDDRHEAWFTYTDAVTPGLVLRHDGRTGETHPWDSATGARLRVGAVRSVRAYCPSVDGTRVPLTVLARPGTGPRPTILYGYGGFGRSLTPQYSSFTLAWVAAGGVFVTANLRGGGEGGTRWHRDGMLDRKQNAVDDYLAVARWLVDNGWTGPEELVGCGESNGGLVVGAAVTQRPELFAAAVCSAALFDMVRYERFGMGASWTGEYGSAADPDQLGHLLGYSPYHLVRPGVAYPAVLLTAFTNDTRVDPLHARKMCAALQHATTSGRPVLLRTERDAGHAGRAVDQAVDLAADLLAFAAAHAGLDLVTAR